MSRTIGVVMLLALLSGCVTETRVNGVLTATDKHSVNKVAVAKTRLTLVVRYLNGGNIEAARRNLELAEQLAPELVDVYITKAHFFQHVSQYDRAATAYEVALRKDPNNGDVLNNFGVMRCDAGNYELADQLFNQALSNLDYVKVADTNENAGLCAYRAGQYDKAQEYFKAALNYSQRRPASLLGLAEVGLQQQDYKLTRRYLQLYKQISPDSAASFMAWIRLEAAEDNFAQEALWGQKLTFEFPNSPQTKRYLADDY